LEKLEKIDVMIHNIYCILPNGLNFFHHFVQLAFLLTFYLMLYHPFGWYILPNKLTLIFLCLCDKSG